VTGPEQTLLEMARHTPHINHRDGLIIPATTNPEPLPPRITNAAQRDPRSILSVATLNTNSLSPSKIRLIEFEVLSRNVDILVLCETRHSKSKVLLNAYNSIGTKRDTKRGGLMLFHKKNLQLSLISRESNEWLDRLSCMLGDIRIEALYCREFSSSARVETKSLLSRISSEPGSLIILGDLNLPSRDHQGFLHSPLIDPLTFQMNTAPSYFCGEMQSKLDYILTNLPRTPLTRRLLPLKLPQFQHAAIFDSVLVDRTPFTLSRPMRLRTFRLNNQKIRKRLIAELRFTMEGLPLSLDSVEGIDASYRELISRLLSVSEKVLGHSQERIDAPTPPKITEEAEIIQRKARKALNDPHALQCDGTLRNPLNSPKFRYDMAVTNSSMGTTNSKRAWTAISKYINPRKTGRADPQELLTHFAQAFSPHNPCPDPLPTNRKRLEEPIDSSPFTEAEIEGVLAALPKYKTPGPDKIPNEILRTTREVLAPALTRLFNAMLALGHIPRLMGESFLFPIPKKGDLTQACNYRPISVITALQKTLSVLIKSRIQAAVEYILSPFQAGFVRHSNCHDNLQVLNSFDPTSTYLLFVDIAKAFDSVNREKLQQAIRRDLGDNPITNLICRMYHDQSSEVMYNRSRIGTVPIRAGVKQGDPLSPLLFNLYFNPALEAIYEEGNISQETPVLAYADDVVIIASTPMELERRAISFKSTLRRLELAISPSKTETINPLSSSIAGFKHTNLYTYLGLPYLHNLGLAGAQEQVDKLEKRLLKIKFLLKNPHLHFSVKRLLYIVLVRSTAEYALLPLESNSPTLSRLNKIQTQAASWILGLSAFGLSEVKQVNCNLLPAETRLRVLSESRYLSWKKHKKNRLLGTDLGARLEMEITSKCDPPTVDEAERGYEALPAKLKMSRFDGDVFIPPLSFSRWRSRAFLDDLYYRTNESLRESPPNTARRFIHRHGLKWRNKDHSYINKLRTREWTRSHSCCLCNRPGTVTIDHALDCTSETMRVARRAVCSKLRIAEDRLTIDLACSPEAEYDSFWINSLLHLFVLASL